MVTFCSMNFYAVTLGEDGVHMLLLFQKTLLGSSRGTGWGLERASGNNPDCLVKSRSL